MLSQLAQSFRAASRRSTAFRPVAASLRAPPPLAARRAVAPRRSGPRPRPSTRSGPRRGPGFYDAASSRRRRKTAPMAAAYGGPTSATARAFNDLHRLWWTGPRPRGRHDFIDRVGARPAQRDVSEVPAAQGGRAQEHGAHQAARWRAPGVYRVQPAPSFEDDGCRRGHGRSRGPLRPRVLGLVCLYDGETDRLRTFFNAAPRESTRLASSCSTETGCVPFAKRVFSLSFGHIFAQRADGPSSPLSSLFSPRSSVSRSMGSRV